MPHAVVSYRSQFGINRTVDSRRFQIHWYFEIGAVPTSAAASFTTAAILFRSEYISGGRRKEDWHESTRDHGRTIFHWAGPIGAVRKDIVRGVDIKIRINRITFTGTVRRAH